ncbi:MAG: iron-sulfur cluster repair di-iron protein [Acidobacteriota bacterium]
MTNSIPVLPFAERPLGDIVKQDARAATVLERFGLDYCCGGHRTLQEAAAERTLNVGPIVEALEALGARSSGTHSDADWEELDTLTRHIVRHHHGYVREITPAIRAWLAKLVARHGHRHPELAQVNETFEQLTSELAAHMAKEENILFPFIDDLAVARRSGTRLPTSPFATVLHPVRVMEADHRAAGEFLARLRSVTHDFALPDDACTTYRLCYAELKRFEADLHWHVHLENNVLFPRALELEQQLA